jgi:hypothetical protein
MSPILKGVVASQISGHLASPSSYESIATVTVGAGGQANASFTSIPGTYKHLQVRVFAQANRAGQSFDNLIYRFNSDSTTSYNNYFLQGVGAGTTSAGGSDTSIYSGTIAATNATNIFTPSITDILDYSSTTKNKTVRTLTGVDENGSGYINFISNGWFNTSAITTITIYPQSGTGWNQYSSFALYGIKG